MRGCKRCILDARYPNLSFGKNGICNLCSEFETAQEKLLDYQRHKKLLQERFDSIRGRYDYDCLVGLSGGKDSSYVASQLKNRFGLKILTFTYDDGLLNDWAKKNIRLVVEKLKVDHIFYTPEQELVREIYRESMFLFGFPCPACVLPKFLAGTRLAIERKIPLRIHGRSPYQMFKEFSRIRPDFLQLNLENNLLPFDTRRNKEILKITLARIASLLNRILSKAHREKFYKDFFPWGPGGGVLEQIMVPEFLGYFLYEPYDEKKIMKTLESEFGWISPGYSKILGHNDCLIHDAATYLHARVRGYSVLAQELSVMVRMGLLSRKEAFERLHSETCLYQEPKESLNTLKRMYGIEHKSSRRIILKAKIIFKLLTQFRKLRSVIK